MEEKTIYTPKGDEYFANPYIDVEEWRDTPVRHLFVHGGFKGTEMNGNEVRFCYYFPEKEKYGGRFFQYVSPAPEDEHESEHLTGEDDKISFCLTHGAYYVVTNQGGFILNQGERLYKSSANGAEYSREVARRVYGYEHRPYGYIFGGSGGSFKTMSCMEMTEGVWDGAVPYVLANPMATPNVFCPRGRVQRVFGDGGMAKLVDAMEPGGSGSVPCGDIHGKVIAVCSLLDECAYAWHGDWYRSAVREKMGGDETGAFRLYYNDHCIHDDRAEYLDDPQHQIDYLGMLHQALLDVAAWCEKGIEPLPTTNYTFVDGQIEVPKTAAERGGLQPVVDSYANGGKCVTVNAGEEVRFTARIEVPNGAGTVTEAAWDFEKTNDFSKTLELALEEDGRVANVAATHVFDAPGTYFPVIKVKSNRHGDATDIFTQCKNLDRVRVIVK